MANIKQAAAKRLNMTQRAEQQLQIQFPGVPAAWLWKRDVNHGFTTVPRTLPIAMQAIDQRSPKGQPAGHVLLCLWARAPDHPLVVVENPAVFAAEAGFLRERAVDTWRRRMKRLRELGFIVTKKGPSGDFHFVLLLNPNAALEWMRVQKLVQDDIYGRFVDRLLEIGAYNDLEVIRAHWKAEAEAAAAAAKAAAPPPPPPPPASGLAPVPETEPPAATPEPTPTT